jgi:hypothetical protein
MLLKWSEQFERIWHGRDNRPRGDTFVKANQF